jgi:hypothetical protein
MEKSCLNCEHHEANLQNKHLFHCKKDEKFYFIEGVKIIGRTCQSYENKELFDLQKASTLYNGI